MASSGTDRSPDVVVVGAGIVGAACAYFLARAGASVHLYERSHRRLRKLRRLRGQRARVGQGARARAAARDALGRALEHAGPRAARRLRVRPQGQRRRGRDGGGAGCRARARRDARRPRSRGRGARRRRPARGGAARAPDLPGGVLYPGDAQLEPRLATAALVRAAQRAGARLLHGRTSRASSAAATGARPRSSTAGGRIPTGAVVVAAGVWTPALLATAGLPRPGDAAQGPGRGDRALPGALPAQAERGRLRRRRRGGRRRTPGRDGGRVDAQRHDAAGKQPRARRLRRRRRSRRRRGRSPGARRASSPSCGTLAGHAHVCRPAAADARPPADHRPARGAAERVRGDGPRRRRHRPRAGHRRARGRVVRGRAARRSARVVLAGALRPRAQLAAS